MYDHMNMMTYYIILLFVHLNIMEAQKYILYRLFNICSFRENMPTMITFMDDR